MQDKLTSFGYEFVVKIVTCLMQDKAFLLRVSDLLKDEYFDSSAAKWVIKTSLRYYLKYKNTPSLIVFKTELEYLTEEEELLKVEIIAFLRDVVRHESAADLEFVKAETVTFCKNQAIKIAIEDSIDLLRKKDYDTIKVKLDQALKIGLSTEVGHRYIEDIEDRYDRSREVVPTPWEVFNNIMQGGLGKGELGLVVAPSGAGKSWALVNIGAAALRAGLTVFHYTLELNEMYTALRYDSVICGFANSQILLHKEEVREIINKLPGRLIVEYYPSKSGSILTLESHIERCKAQEIYPDIIIVDYADLLKGYGKELRHELNNIYLDLRGLAGLMQIPIWTASQANRSSMEESVVRGDKISEDYSKIMISDFIFSLAGKDEMVLTDTVNAFVIKNRFGEDRRTYPASFVRKIGTIDIHTPATKAAEKVQKKMDDGVSKMREDLQKKYLDFFEDKNK